MTPRVATYLRDPIYGLVPLSPGEAELLRLPLLTRLKSIHQMGFAWSVFPGANHTRFEHSVGVMHNAGLLVRDLPGFTPRDVQMVRLAGLLHDVGHPPFSHTMELAARLYGRELQAPELSALASHEKATERRVAGDPGLAEALRKFPEFRGIDPKELAALAVGRSSDSPLSPLVHGEIDADRIDYIVRDNHHCGFPSGLDVHLIPSLFLKRPDGEIVLNLERAYFAEQLLMARHHLQVQIHDEPRNRLADLLLARALREFFRQADRRARRSFARIVEEAGDDALLALLREGAPEATGELEQHLTGSTPWQPLATIPFSSISPPGRYAVSLLLSEEHRDLSTDLARRLTSWFSSEVLADIWGATPPTGALRTAAPGSPAPPVPITSLPLIRGTIAATHRAMGIRLYTRASGPPARLELSRAQVRYQQRVDELFDTSRAGRLYRRLDPEEARSFLATMEVESALQETAAEGHRDRTFAPDAILLLLHALFEAFAQPPLEEVRVYLEGASGFARAAQTGGLPGSWEKAFPTPFPYALATEDDEEEGDLTPSARGDLEADLDRLEAYGLVVRLPREERRGRHFASRDRYALSGWGRGLVANLLLKDPRLSRIHTAVQSALAWQVREHEESFRAFFGLAGRRGSQARQARRVRRSDLPIPVSR